MSEDQLSQQRRERRIFAKLKRQILSLNDLDRQREEQSQAIAAGLRKLAKARGVAFIRLESIRQEIHGNG